MPRPPRAAGPVALVVALLVVATGGCGGDGGGKGGAGRATGRFGAIHTGVCAAVAAAEAGDLTGAQQRFDDVHVGLHDLASAAEEDDRAVAARLLEAKQRVEAQLTAASLDALVAPVAAAVEATGGTAPETCP